MDSGKFIELQRQMRENNEEVNDFLKDISSWKEDVASKSAKLGQQANNGDSSLPAVRNSLLRRRKKKSNHKMSDTTASKTKMNQKERIKSADYKAWDNFDVDKALTEIDVDGSEGDMSRSSSSSETDEECERLRRTQLSSEARELGNIRFKEGRFEEAVEQYTLAVRLTPDDPIPYTNRAFALLRLERHASAEADCSTALSLDDKCMKALYRRASARKAMGNTDAAITDLQSILRLDSVNKAALSELEALLTSRKSADEGTTPSVSAVTPMHARLIHKDRTNTVMRRIPIVEVGGVKASAHATETRTSDRSVDALQSSTTCKPNAVATPALILSAPSHQQSSPVNVNEPEKKYPHIMPIISSTVSQYSVPSNWFQLERELRELTNQRMTHSTTGSKVLTESAADYLWAIPPNQYSKVIGRNLETRLLANLLQVYHRRSTSQSEFALADKIDLAQRLNGLSSLPRFDVIWLMADEAEHQLFDQLINCLQVTSGDDTSDQLADLIGQIRRNYT